MEKPPETITIATGGVVHNLPREARIQCLIRKGACVILLWENPDGSVNVAHYDPDTLKREVSSLPELVRVWGEPYEGTVDNLWQQARPVSRKTLQKITRGPLY